MSKYKEALERYEFNFSTDEMLDDNEIQARASIFIMMHGEKIKQALKIAHRLETGEVSDEMCVCLLDTMEEKAKLEIEDLNREAHMKSMAKHGISSANKQLIKECEDD